MALTTCEVTWLMTLLKDLGLKAMLAAALKFDNQAALSIVVYPVYHKRTKYIEVDCHFIKEKVNQDTIQTSYIPSKERITNVLTKALPSSSTQQTSQQDGSD